MSTWRLRSGGSLCPPEHNFCCAGSLCPALILAIILVVQGPCALRSFPAFHVSLDICYITPSYVRTGHRARSPQSWLQSLIQTIQFPLSRIVLNILPNRFQCRLSTNNMVMESCSPQLFVKSLPIIFFYAADILSSC